MSILNHFTDSPANLSKKLGLVLVFKSVFQSGDHSVPMELVEKSRSRKLSARSEFSVSILSHFIDSPANWWPLGVPGGPSGLLGFPEGSWVPWESLGVLHGPSGPLGVLREVPRGPWMSLGVLGAGWGSLGRAGESWVPSGLKKKWAEQKITLG